MTGSTCLRQHLFVCNELQSPIEQIPDDKSWLCCKESGSDALVFSYQCRLLYHRPSIWCFQTYCDKQDKCAAIVKILLPKYIRVPWGDEFEETSIWTWIHAVCQGGWWNPHSDCVSNKMQGMAENVGRFTEDVYIGWHGGVHNARVSSSPTGEKPKHVERRFYYWC